MLLNPKALKLKHIEAFVDALVQKRVPCEGKHPRGLVPSGSAGMKRCPQLLGPISQGVSA